MSINPTIPPYSQCVEPASARATGTMILLVEDEYGVREFVRLGLEHAGYGIVATHDGDHGFAEYVANPNRFSLVLSDVIMPNRTGPELVQLVRRIRPEIPVILMSAYTGGMNSTPLELPQDVTLLEKPFSLDQLLHAVILAIKPKSYAGSESKR